MKSFKFDSTELTILKSFSQINPSQMIYPTGFKVINQAESVIGRYKFSKAYDFKPFGIYDLPELLSVINALNNPEITIKDNHLILKNGDSSVSYLTTPENIIKQVPDIDKNLPKFNWNLEFVLTADKLAFIQKIASIIKAGKLYLVSEDKKLDLIVVDDLDTSSNKYTLAVKDSYITKLDFEGILEINLNDLKVYNSSLDYTIRAADAKITYWSSNIDLEYFIGCSEFESGRDAVTTSSE